MIQMELKHLVNQVKQKDLWILKAVKSGFRTQMVQVQDGKQRMGKCGFQLDPSPVGHTVVLIGMYRIQELGHILTLNQEAEDNERQYNHSYGKRNYLLF